MHPIKEKLDKISPSFCSAKWLQVTLRLQNGHNHSCHHPKTHKISLDEIKKNPDALHDTAFKKQQRKMMLEGQRPPECSYCWKVEDLPGNHISDRFIKSDDTWSKPYIDEISKQPWDQNTQPTYLEVSFSNICNFKCAYCYPDVSSKWMSEVKEHGPYPTSNSFGSLLYLEKEKTYPLPEKDNPYIDTFWKWIPEKICQLKVLRVTGGEPLLSKDCLRLIQFLSENSNPNLSFSINSNLGVPSSIVEKTTQTLSDLVASKNLRSGHIYTSLDTWGNQAEYIRYGLDLELWKKNLDICLSFAPQVEVVIMVTFNALSVFKFKEFLQFVLEKRKLHIDSPKVDVSILHDPPFLNILTLDEDQKKLIFDSLTFMKENSSEVVPHGFSSFEIAKFERILEYSKTKVSYPDLYVRRQDLMAFVQEYDRRKKTDFFECFPEMFATFKAWNKMKRPYRFIFLSHLINALTQKISWHLHHRLPFLFGR